MTERRHNWLPIEDSAGYPAWQIALAMATVGFGVAPKTTQRIQGRISEILRHWEITSLPLTHEGGLTAPSLIKGLKSGTLEAADPTHPFLVAWVTARNFAALREFTGPIGMRRRHPVGLFEITDNPAKGGLAATPSHPGDRILMSDRHFHLQAAASTLGFAPDPTRLGHYIVSPSLTGLRWEDATAIGNVALSRRSAAAMGMTLPDWPPLATHWEETFAVAASAAINIRDIEAIRANADSGDKTLMLQSVRSRQRAAILSMKEFDGSEAARRAALSHITS